MTRCEINNGPARISFLHINDNPIHVPTGHEQPQPTDFIPGAMTWRLITRMTHGEYYILRKCVPIPVRIIARDNHTYTGTAILHKVAEDRQDPDFPFSADLLGASKLILENITNELSATTNND